MMNDERFEGAPAPCEEQPQEVQPQETVPPAQPQEPQVQEAQPPMEASPEVPTWEIPAQRAQPQEAAPPVQPYGPSPWEQPQWNQPQWGQPQPPQWGHPQPPQAPYAAPAWGQPQWGQPQWNQPQPMYGPGPVYYPPKKKMPLGLKVFLWIASILAVAAIAGFAVFTVYTVVNRAPSSWNELPHGELPDLPYGDEEPGGDVPKFDDDVTPPDDTEDDADLPNVDVTPNTEGITIHGTPEGDELSAKEVYSQVVKSTVTVAASRQVNGQETPSTGTGIIATSDGYIITNSHVVLNSKSTTVKITTYDGKEYDALVVGLDRTSDLAVLKTNDYNFTPAQFGSAEELEIGDEVVAIGNPGGAKFSGSMTGGYISGLDRAVGQYSENGMTFIQTDAAINPGNSGGPLVNMYGQVVGINSSKIVSEGYEGMGFAIPVSQAKDIIDQLLSGGYVKGRVRLGITGMDTKSDYRYAMMGAPEGFVILEIDEGSSFAGTDAQEGDVIVGLDGETVTCLSEISNLLLKYAPGDQVTVTLYRPNGRGLDGTELDVTITLLEDKGETQK